MLSEITCFREIYIACGRTDLRKGIEAGRIKWPRNQTELAQISENDYRQLLSGMTILETSSVQKVSCTEIA